MGEPRGAALSLRCCAPVEGNEPLFPITAMNLVQGPLTQPQEGRRPGWEGAGFPVLTHRGALCWQNLSYQVTWMCECACVCRLCGCVSVKQV